MDDQLSRFFSGAAPIDYRHFLKPLGLDFALLESEAPGERHRLCGPDGRLLATARVVPLEWDSSFFSAASARLEGIFFDVRERDGRIRKALMRDLVERCDRQAITFLACRTRSDDLHFIQALEEQGFRMVDSMTVYTQSLESKGPLAVSDFTSVWPLLRGWICTMEWGRFFQDPAIGRSLAERFYLDTTRHYLEAGAHLTLHYEDGVPVGAAIGVIEEDVSRHIGRRYGVLWLIIVDPDRRGRGIGKRLFDSFCSGFAHSCDMLEIGTQIYNTGANLIYLKAGCTVAAHLCTFHRWKDAR